MSRLLMLVMERLPFNMHNAQLALFTFSKVKSIEHFPRLLTMNMAFSLKIIDYYCHSIYFG